MISNQLIKKSFNVRKGPMSGGGRAAAAAGSKGTLDHWFKRKRGLPKKIPPQKGSGRPKAPLEVGVACQLV